MTKERNILVYHHNDLDGYAAAAAVFYGMNLHACKDVELNFEFRSIAFPTIWETFVNEDTEPREFNEVVIVDYGFTTNNVGILKDLVEYLNYTAEHIYWIDHHITSVDAKKGLPKFDKFKFTSYINTSRSGAWLAYEYFSEMDDDDIYNERLPMVIKYIDDYDRWVHNYPGSMLLNDAWFCTPELKDPESDEWDALLNEDTKYLNSLIEKGKIVNQYRDQLAESHKKFAYEVTIKGFEQYSAVALNDRGNSKCFGDLVKQYQICILYHENKPGEIAMSLYSDPAFVEAGVDVSPIALKHNGGGHPGASGCSMSVEEFYRVVKPK